MCLKDEVIPEIFKNMEKRIITRILRDVIEENVYEI